MFALLFVAVLALLGLRPATADAQADNQVKFTLEGCRLLTTTTLPNGSGDFVCSDGEYTSGNLGKNWNELDLVPHRLTTENNNGDQTYGIVIAADNKNHGTTGYDLISVPELNTTLSSGTCSIVVGAQTDLTPGTGGVDTTIYRLLTITQTAGSTCVWDYWERLALGSAQFPGSSLHSNLLNEDLKPGGVGARDVPLPVNKAQGLAKTMSAVTGSGNAWNVTKDSSPTDLSFDTCSGGANAQAKPVTITVTWTKSAANPAEITITTNITITNPAHRAVQATVTDVIYAGTTQTTQVGTTFTSALTSIPANSSMTVTNIQTVPIAAGTHFNDVATATYTDPDAPASPIPGTTTATADADLQVINAPNDTATVSDVEQITGSGLTFSADSTVPAGAAALFQGGYVLGTETTGPLMWSDTVQASGQVVFNKTVHVDGQRNTSGVLSDTATLVDAAGTTHTANDSTTIAARACITGAKFYDVDADGTRDPGEPPLAGVTIYVDLDSDGVFDPGEPSAVTAADGTYSISTANIPDGTYTVREVVPTGYACSAPPTCANQITVGPGGPVTGADFGNYRPVSVSGVKFLDADRDGIRDLGEGGLAGFTFYVDYDGDGLFDAGEPSAVSVADGSWTITGLRPGVFKVREVVSANHVCTTPSPCEYSLTLVSGEDQTGFVFGNFRAEPAIQIDKTGPATAVAGTTITYTLDVTNPGNVKFAAADVAVTDARCTASAPALVSKNGDLTPDTLDPGDRWTYTCGAATAVGDTSVTNLGVVTGRPEIGSPVSDDDDAVTTLTQPPAPDIGRVVGEVITTPLARVTRGRAAVVAPTRCVSNRFTVTVTGRRMASVTFFVDGKRVKRVTGSTTRARLALNAARYRSGAHRITATVTFQRTSQTATRTLRAVIRRCAAARVAPTFAG